MVFDRIKLAIAVQVYTLYREGFKIYACLLSHSQQYK